MAAAPYTDSNPCSEEEAFMACAVDVNMKAVAETQGIFTGAPPPLECYPQPSSDDDSVCSTGAWDSTIGSIDPKPARNTFGLDNIEGELYFIVHSSLCTGPTSFLNMIKYLSQGCCWWGRGPFSRGSAGTCMIGKLNYYLGARAFDAGECVKNIIGVLLLVEDVDDVAGDTVSVGIPEGLGDDVGVAGGAGRQSVFAQHVKSSGQSVSEEDTHGE